MSAEDPKGTASEPGGWVEDLIGAAPDETTMAAGSENIASIRAAATRMRDQPTHELKNTAFPVDLGDSLISGKAPPEVVTNYWDRKDIAAIPASSGGSKGRLPGWFVAATVLAVVIAIAVVLLVLLAISGGSS